MWIFNIGFDRKKTDRRIKIASRSNNGSIFTVIYGNLYSAMMDRDNARPLRNGNHNTGGSTRWGRCIPVASMRRGRTSMHDDIPLTLRTLMKLVDVVAVVCTNLEHRIEWLSECRWYSIQYSQYSILSLWEEESLLLLIHRNVNKINWMINKKFKKKVCWCVCIINSVGWNK